MSYTTLVDAATLAAQLGNPEWVVFDCRHDLTDTEAGRRAYREAHIPGARFAHLDEDLSGKKTGSNGRHPLPAEKTFSAWLGKMGVDEGKQVVAYDAATGPFAARLWWMLKWLGHERAAVLDGGFKFWRSQNLPVTTSEPEISASTFTPRTQDNLVDARHVESHLGRDDCIVVDARSADRFRGENETLDPVGGHIPGARNHPFMQNVDEEGRFKPAAALRQSFSDLLRGMKPENVVHQCGSGVTACHNLLAMEISGLKGSRLYPGSWSEWCSDPRRPVSRR
jgi:thiosulfate/3-mercaptopyruvate sulfurtransferase